MSISELFHAACLVLGVEASVSVDPRHLRPDASEVLVLESDPTAAREKLKWTVSTSLEDRLRKDGRMDARSQLELYRASFHL